MWTYYYSTVQGIIFLIDATDMARIGVVRDELALLLDHSDVKKRRPAILLFVNKSDVESVPRMTPAQIRTLLNISQVEERFKVKVVAGSALTGAGVEEAFQWLAISH